MDVCDVCVFPSALVTLDQGQWSYVVDGHTHYISVHWTYIGHSYDSYGIETISFRWRPRLNHVYGGGLTDTGLVKRQRKDGSTYLTWAYPKQGNPTLSGQVDHPRVVMIRHAISMWESVDTIRMPVVSQPTQMIDWSTMQ